MAEIIIEKESATPTGWQFIVKVDSPTKTTEHTVSVSTESWQSLTDEKISPQELITKSFIFLLARESNESILRTFNITDITHYFPDFPTELQKTIPAE